MAKKKRNSNPNLKYSQASKRDEGNRSVENVPNGDEAELGASMAKKSATTSSHKQGNGASSSSFSVDGKIGSAAALNSSEFRGHCSNSKIPDLLENKRVTSTSWDNEEGDASFPIISSEEGAGPATVHSGKKQQLRATHDNGDAGINLASAFKLSRCAINSKGKKLDFFSPIIKGGRKTVQLQPPELNGESEKWKFALVFYVIGVKPSYNAVRSFVNHHWGKLADCSIFFHNDGYFILRFKANVIDEIVCNGPYNFSGKPIVVKQWKVGFDFQAEMNRCVPVWVCFPNLPLLCWSENSLSRLGSALGVPLYADRCTSNQLRISYARMLIEIDVTKPLDTTIMVEGVDGVPFEQRVTYEWVPHFCSKCYQVGHNCEHKLIVPKKKKKRGKKVWAPKKNQVIEDEKEGNIPAVMVPPVLGVDLARGREEGKDAAATTKAVAVQQLKDGRCEQQHNLQLLNKQAGSLGQQGEVLENVGDVQGCAPLGQQQQTSIQPKTPGTPQGQQQHLVHKMTQQHNIACSEQLQGSGREVKQLSGDDGKQGQPRETSIPLDFPSYLNITKRKIRGKCIPP